jgi:hypothetical protein
MRHFKDVLLANARITLLSSREMVKWHFFLSGVEILRVLGIEVSTNGSTKSNVGSFEAFVTIYLSITIINCTKYLIIKLSLLTKSL